MAIQLKRTSELSAHGIKMLVYGQAGAGKTMLIPSLPSPVVLSAESGLLTIKGANVPFIEIKSLADLEEAYQWALTSDEAKGFESIALDSISEIAEVVLVNAKKGAKDPRQAYGEMADSMADLVRKFRDLPGRNVYFSAKLEKSQDELGRTMYAPMMPGAKTGQALPYFFDLVMPLRVERDENGQVYRVLQTAPDGVWTAKARGFNFDVFEPADLGALIKKAGS